MEIRQVCADYHDTAGEHSAPCIFTVRKHQFNGYLEFVNAIKIQNSLFVCLFLFFYFKKKNLFQGYDLFWLRWLCKRNPTAEFQNITAYVITSIFFFFLSHTF